MIGPSGCGKTTLLRSVNRINERIPYVRTQGKIDVLGKNIMDSDVNLAQLRKAVGMVFQRPNPLSISVRENILFSTRIHGQKSDRNHHEQIVEEALKKVLLWDKVSHRLSRKATELSREEQQKLRIARLLPLKPAVLLMDEPRSALDPNATERVEELIWQLRGDYTILIVTHNMAQARRASDECAFMLMGKLIEHDKTEQVFLRPKHRETADYIEGRYG